MPKATCMLKPSLAQDTVEIFNVIEHPVWFSSWNLEHHFSALVSCFVSTNLVCNFMRNALVRRRHKVKREKSSAKRLAKALHLLLARRRRNCMHSFINCLYLSLPLASRALSTLREHPSSAHLESGTRTERCLTFTLIRYFKYINI